MATVNLSGYLSFLIMELRNPTSSEGHSYHCAEDHTHLAPDTSQVPLSTPASDPSRQGTANDPTTHEVQLQSNDSPKLPKVAHCGPH